MVISLALSQSGPPQATYNSRTVEDWLYNSSNAHPSNWEKEKAGAQIAIVMLGDKAAEPLSSILRLKSPNWVVYNWQKIPFGNRILSRPLKNVEKKQRVFECLKSVGLLEPLLPDIVAVAEDKREFFRIRQMALAYFFVHMPLTTETSNTLVRLSADAAIGPEAARYLQSFQQQLRNEEIRKTRQLIDDRLNAAKPSDADPFSTTNSLFNPNRSLWETGQ